MTACVASMVRVATSPLPPAAIAAVTGTVLAMRRRSLARCSRRSEVGASVRMRAQREAAPTPDVTRVACCEETVIFVGASASRSPAQVACTSSGWIASVQNLAELRRGVGFALATDHARVTQRRVLAAIHPVFRCADDRGNRSPTVLLARPSPGPSQAVTVTNSGARDDAALGALTGSMRSRYRMTGRTPIQAVVRMLPGLRGSPRWRQARDIGAAIVRLLGLRSPEHSIQDVFHLFRLRRSPRGAAPNGHLLCEFTQRRRSLAATVPASVTAPGCCVG